MEQKQIKILYQPLKAKWYKMIESGQKLEEYREETPYWCKRLLGRDRLPTVARLGTMDINRAGYTHVQFSNGYPKKGDTARRMTFELNGVVYREGIEAWGAEKGKKYLVEILGRRTSLDGTKMWDE